MNECCKKSVMLAQEEEKEENDSDHDWDCY